MYCILMIVKLKEHVVSLNFFFFSSSGKPSFTKKQADLFFPPDFADDFPVAMQVLNLLMFLTNLV